jgi:hypothetical protein
LLDVVEELLSLFRGSCAFVSELADGIAQVGHCVLRVESVSSQMIGGARRVQEGGGRSNAAVSSQPRIAVKDTSRMSLRIQAEEKVLPMRAGR